MQMQIDKYDNPLSDVAETEDIDPFLLAEGDPGFRVINPNTPEVKYHIYDNSLRDSLVDYEFLPSNATWPNSDLSDAKKKLFNDRAVYSMSSMIKTASLGGFRRSISRNNVSSNLREIFDSFGEQLAHMEAAAIAIFKETKLVSYATLPFILANDSLIGVVRSDGVTHAAEVVGIKSRSSFMFGEYYHIELRIVTSSAKGFVYSQAHQFVMGFPGEVALQSIGLFEVDETSKAAMVARGKKYVELTTTPAYVHYNSTLKRTVNDRDRLYRATGRVMVDKGSMETMDPNYTEYHGKKDPYDREENQDGDLDMTLERNLLICSPYVYGFSFLAKAWGEMTVDHLSLIKFRNDAFDQLVLDPKFKRIIKALVATEDTNESGDIIEGKGGGVSFLLHGTPGLGKTLTAEAIAELLHLPLYSVSSGELGTNPIELDEKLKNILDIATTWNAILLIDEADIFLERRTKTDIHRNAMVGIFLRLMEYYQGILFLTTNRVEEIDEAFFSRISLGIHYPDLRAEDRKAIWNTLLSYAGTVDDTVDTSVLANEDLNGRQIKHIIRQAAILAKSEDRPLQNKDITDIMDVAKEFRKVIKRNN